MLLHQEHYDSVIVTLSHHEWYPQIVHSRIISPLGLNTLAMDDPTLSIVE